MADNADNNTNTNSDGKGGGGAAPETKQSPDATGKAALQAAQARVTELESQVKEWAPKVGAYDSLQTQFNQAKEEWATKETGWGTERDLLKAGITDAEAVDVVTMFYGKVPVEQGKEKPSLADWLGNREALPKAVQAYLPAATDKGTDTKGASGDKGGNKNTTTTPQPNANKGATGNGAPGGGTFNAQALTTMGTDTYKANRDAILASLGKR